jgi:hypothetical protein
MIAKMINLRIPQSLSTFGDFLLASVGMRTPSKFFQRQIHIFNLLSRCAVLCIGSTLLYTEGVQCAPGIVSQPYMENLWINTTDMDWKNNRLPALQTSTSPGSSYIVLVWYGISTCLFLCDFFRCALLSSNNWDAGANQIDMSWMTISVTVIPFIFSLVALLLGTRDLIILILIITLTTCSGICGFVIESLRCVVNPHSIVGMSRSVLYILRVAQDGLLILAAEVAMIPFLHNIIYNNEPAKITDITLAFNFSGFVLLMWATTYHHSSMCNRFERNWPTDNSTLSWAEVPFVSSIQTDDIVVVPTNNSCRSSTYSIVRVDLVYATDGDEVPFNAKSRLADDCVDCRATIGRIVEWRRYYTINTFIDVILILSIFIITGMTEVCDFSNHIQT